MDPLQRIEASARECPFPAGQTSRPVLRELRGTALTGAGREALAALQRIHDRMKAGAVYQRESPQVQLAMPPAGMTGATLETQCRFW